MAVYRFPFLQMTSYEPVRVLNDTKAVIEESCFERHKVSVTED